MRGMDKHFRSLTPSAKQPARSRVPPRLLYFLGDPDVGILTCVRFGVIHFGRCPCQCMLKNWIGSCCDVGGCRRADNGWSRAEHVGGADVTCNGPCWCWRWPLLSCGALAFPLAPWSSCCHEALNGRLEFVANRLDPVCRGLCLCVAIGAQFVLTNAKEVIVEAGAFVSDANIIVSEVAMGHQRLRSSI
jgi:hypothetical protein